MFFHYVHILGIVKTQIINSLLVEFHKQARHTDEKPHLSTIHLMVHGKVPQRMRWHCPALRLSVFFR